MTRSLKIFDIPLGDGGKPNKLYDEQRMRQKLMELLQGPRGLKITQVTPEDLGAGHPDRRGAPDKWWETGGWPSEKAGLKFLKDNPDLHKEHFPHVEL